MFTLCGPYSLLVQASICMCVCTYVCVCVCVDTAQNTVIYILIQ